MRAHGLRRATCTDWRKWRLEKWTWRSWVSLQRLAWSPEHSQNPVESTLLLRFLHRSVPDFSSSGEGTAGGTIWVSHLRIHFLGSVLLHLSFLGSVKSQQPVKIIVTCALQLLWLQNSLSINTLQLATWKPLWVSDVCCSWVHACLRGWGWIRAHFFWASSGPLTLRFAHVSSQFP